MRLAILSVAWLDFILVGQYSSVALVRFAVQHLSRARVEFGVVSGCSDRPDWRQAGPALATEGKAELY